ncbi:biopolymer transport protein ExbB/TolQ [Arcanobacterium wilhelmae]|uniref:Biopolymer transport protein ExbB/TolQ n=1 Tax=Arcanobacterium wilhelmae TaxID=1803177 RepID=A0ABT9N8J0_9ACTO|nr:hypothetical protein [Arcanobacterium wilhelmae]MDP9800018.1 biopolymer transport protein ExbB/TolQ [Arcanobacterium wilhelmae]WFN89515.1 hypothetical protein P8A24_04700 [Arcanobacterium wilhelmae]
MIWWIFWIGIVLLALYFVASIRRVWRSSKGVFAAISGFVDALSDVHAQGRGSGERGDMRQRRAAARADRERIRSEREAGRRRRLSRALERWPDAEETFEKRTQ